MSWGDMNAEQAKRVGQWVRQARESRRWTQIELADKVGVSLETIAKIETARQGKRGPSMRTIRGIETALSVAPGSLDRVAEGEAVSLAPAETIADEDLLALIAEIREQIQHLSRRVERLEGGTPRDD